ncbi:hypothetical protein [Streptomyces sp. NPDC088847]|uniref:hypothetical protein n=1 Tax=Streptomyces sp. NPDC088847 TaxID=3365909 RepID=UPI00380D1F11
MIKHPSTRCRSCGLDHGPVRHPDGTPPTPFGCRWCGIAPDEHRGRRTAAAGLHTWQHPTRAQILARMLARRSARAEARRLAQVETAFSRAAGLVGPAERRRRERATAPAPQPAPVPRRCEAMTHNAVGSERYCEIEDPDHREDHDAGDGTTWPVEDWEREAA